MTCLRDTINNRWSPHFWPVLGTAIALVLMGSALLWVDQTLARAVADLPPGLIDVFQTVTGFGNVSWAVIPLLIAGTAYWIWQRRAPRGTLFVLAAIAGAGLSVQMLKPLAGRARPRLLILHDQYGFAWGELGETLLNASMNSFPSGHSAAITALAGAVSALFPRACAACVGFAGLVALSRPIIGAHFMSDVIAGALIGWLWSTWLARRPWFQVPTPGVGNPPPRVQELLAQAWRRARARPSRRYSRGGVAGEG